MDFLKPEMLIPAVPVMLLALTVHEWAHAYTAWRLGDPTARMLGRMTLNPLAHLDLFGTLAIVLIGFGWARPVPVSMVNLKHPRRDMMWISVAGPLSNLIQALLFGLVFQLVGRGLADVGLTGFFGRMIFYGIFINSALAVFNLIPVPPLDGSKILYGLFPSVSEQSILKLEHYGPMVLMGLIFIGFFTQFSPLWMIMGPPVHALVSLFSGGLF